MRHIRTAPVTTAAARYSASRSWRAERGVTAPWPPARSRAVVSREGRYGPAPPPPATTGRIYTHLIDRTHEETLMRVSDALK